MSPYHDVDKCYDLSDNIYQCYVYNSINAITYTCWSVISVVHILLHVHEGVVYVFHMAGKRHRLKMHHVSCPLCMFVMLSNPNHIMYHVVAVIGTN